MKLVVQIPCFNEADVLPQTLSELPRAVPGFEAVEFLVIDDGSTDGTADVARAHGVDHVLRFPVNRGLARAFTAGLRKSLAVGADVVVNTDADNQYRAEDIPVLVRPLLEQKADLVIGERPLQTSEHLTWVRKLLQRLGSRVVRLASRTEVRDAPSGFRAMNRRAMIELRVFNDYSYTLETIIQAGHKGLSVVSVPVRTNPPTRPSRLFSSVPSYIRKQSVTIARILTTYKPFHVFMTAGAISFLCGFLIGVRFLVFYLSGAGSGHVQSLLLAAILMVIGFLLGVTGVLADLISVNRQLLEEIDTVIKDRFYGTGPDSGPIAESDAASGRERTS